MLQFNDFDEKQILFIESYDIKNISFLNENLIIKENNEIKQKVSLYKIFVIFLIGETTLTSVIIRKLQDFGVTLVLLRKNLLSYAIIGNQTEGNVILRKKQYEINDEQMLNIAKNIIKIKTQNQLLLLKNERNKSLDTKGNIKKISVLIDKIDTSKNYESLLGYEGNIAKIFFKNYFKKIGWNKRMPRTKIDIPNVLLDIGYTFLFNFVEALLRLYGFDNYYGVYHKTWYQRKSLALDLIEPFRCIIDKELLKSYNLKQINEKDFGFKNGAYYIKPIYIKKYTKIFLTSIMNHKKEIFYFIKDYYKFFIKPESKFPNFNIINK